MNNFTEWLQINENTNWGHGGWKIHLRTGTDNKIRDRAYQIVQEIIKNNKKNWPSKKLGGGEADQKDITIYCGPKSEANIAAKAIAEHPELSKLLSKPSEEMLRDDVEILPGTNVYGRFNASLLMAMTKGVEFHQYGCKGHSMLNSFVTRSMTDKENFDRTKACQDSYRLLKNLFGKDFTDN
jgi:hypothetical protein